MPFPLSPLLLLACVAGTTPTPGPSTPTFDSNDICAVGVVDEMTRYPRDLFVHTYGLFLTLMAAGNTCLGAGPDPVIEAGCSTTEESYTGSVTLYYSKMGTGLAFDDFHIIKPNEVTHIVDGYLTVASNSADTPGHMTHDNLQVRITELTAGSCDCVAGDVVVEYVDWVSTFPLAADGLPDTTAAWTGSVSASLSEATLGTATATGSYEEHIGGCDLEPEQGGLELSGAPGIARTTYDTACDSSMSATLASGAAASILVYPFAP